MPSALDERARAAAVWRRRAQSEQASVAAFARASMELMAVAAPLELVRRSHEAALDEIIHTCAWASRAPSTTPHRGARGAPRVARARGDGRRGCTRRARRGPPPRDARGGRSARGASRGTTFAPARAALAIIARDEQRHAALAADIVSWARAQGATATARARPQAPARGHTGLAAYGILDDDVVRRVFARTLASMA